jgi:hypothetical protein
MPAGTGCKANSFIAVYYLGGFMRKAILWAFMGVLLGVAGYPAISVFIFHTRVEGSTAGCVGLVLGIILFAIVFSRERAKKKALENKDKQ